MKKIILAFLLITVVFIFLFLKNATFWKPVPEYSDLSANLISDEHIVGGYQISKSGNEILLLTKSSNEHNILLWDSKKGVLVKLNPTHIPLNIDTFNNKNYRGTTQAFVGVNDNIYFESGLNLIEISPSYNIKVYDYLSDNIPHTPEEIENKTKS
ncbi:hypothetical protein KKB06_00705, partial [Patescibacteria group bacterium]|nr:hypothetical protein [Patescibacteria group bacterium]